MPARAASKTDNWHVYLVRTRNGSLYTGIATDVERRLREHLHSLPRGAKCLRSRGPLQLVYRAHVGSRGLALRVEHRLKGFTKRRKEEIVASQPAGDRLLKLLSLDGPA